MQSIRLPRHQRVRRFRDEGGGKGSGWCGCGGRLWAFVRWFSKRGYIIYATDVLWAERVACSRDRQAHLRAAMEPEFSIGWTGASQLNDFQLRKSKNKEVTGKITTQAIIQGQYPPQYAQSPLRQLNAYDPPPSRDYPSYENLSQEELEKLMQRYEDYRGGAPSRKDDRLSENSAMEKRAAIRPRESMKDIIYNGIGVAEEAQKPSRQQRTNSNNYAYRN